VFAEGEDGDKVTAGFGNEYCSGGAMGGELNGLFGPEQASMGWGEVRVRGSSCFGISTRAKEEKDGTVRIELDRGI